jgi:hypothetical protein
MIIIDVEEKWLDIIGYRALYSEFPEEILYTGIKAKEKTVCGIPMQYRSFLDEDPPDIGEMDPTTVNCCSTKFALTSIFPLFPLYNKPFLPIYTHIYIVYIKNGFSTYEQQQLDAWSILAKDNYAMFEDEEYRENLIWPLNMQELATTSISPEHVLGFVKCHRLWNCLYDWEFGGTFTLEGPLHRQEPRVIDPRIYQRANKVLDRVENSRFFSERGQLVVPVDS